MSDSELATLAPYARWQAWTPIALAVAVNAVSVVLYRAHVDCAWAPDAARCRLGEAVIPFARLTALGDLTARLQWIATLMLMIASVAVATWTACRATAWSSRRLDGRWRHGVWWAVGVAALVGLGYAVMLSSYRLPVVLWLRTRVMPSLVDDVVMRGLRNGAYGFSAAILATGFCSVLVPGTRKALTIAELREQVEHAQVLLYAGGALLVSYVLETAATYAWGLGVVPEAQRDAATALVRALTVMTGTTYSLMLAGLALPALILLRRHAARLAEETLGREGAVAPADVRAWLERHELVRSLPQEVGSLAAILSPVLAGSPVAALLGALGS
jgi:hypothetical protein